MVRILGVALVLAGLTLGAASVATAEGVRVEGSLFSQTTACAGVGAVAVVPDVLDGGRPVRLSTDGWSAQAVAGEVVVVPVEAGTIEVKAAGFRDGLPHDLIDRVSVEEPCR